MLGAPRGELGSDRPIDVDLPDRVCQGREIITSSAPRPGKPISSMDMTCRSAAQWAVAVVEHDLGNRAEEILTGKLETDEARHHYGRDACPYHIRQPTVGSREGKYLVGGRDQSSCEFTALSIITVE
jgi:hypothetical protein